MPFMIFMVLGIFIGFLQIFTNGLQGLLFAIVFAVVDIYFFICIYSLYSKLKDEKLGQGVSSTFAQPQQTVIIMQDQQYSTAYNQPPMFYHQSPPNYAQPSASQAYQQDPMDLQQNPDEKMKI